MITGDIIQEKVQQFLKQFFKRLKMIRIKKAYFILFIITVFATILSSSAWAKNIAVEENVLNDNSDIYFFKGKDTVGIEFTFANGEITTSDDTTFYEFDVMAAASEAGTKIGTGIALINYNTAGFGSSIHLNGKVTVKKGTLTTTQGPPLYIIIVNDNQTYRLAITFEYISEPGWGNDLPDTATQLVHVKIEIADQTETAGLSFAEDLMSDQQYYDDNATKYNPVIAIDEDNTTLPVELSAFTALYNADHEDVIISWTTQSETDVQGFNIYRSESEDFSAMGGRINYTLIPSESGNSTTPVDYSYRDETADIYTTYYYWLETVDISQMSCYYGPTKYTPVIDDGPPETFDEYKLSACPNPAHNSTSINYQLKGSVDEQNAEIRIYNILGELVKTIEGTNGTAELDLSDLGSGIYFYQLQTDNYNEVKKMVVVK